MNVLTKAIVRPPAPNFAEGLTTANLGAPDYQRALVQHDVYCQTLRQCGLKVIKLDPDPLYPDSTFVEDTAVPLVHRGVLTRPGAPSRAGEVHSMEGALAEAGIERYFIRAPGTLDGGDVCEAERRFFIGISERTNEAGAQQFADMVDGFRHLGYKTSFVDITKSGTGVRPVTHAQDARATHHILHLKSGISYLGEGRLAVVESLADRPEFRGYDLVRVNAEEAYAANCIRVNYQVLLAAGFPVFERKLRELGYQTIALEMSEFQKMDGGLSCLSLRF